MFPDRHLELWDRIGLWSLVAGAILGVIALLITAASAYILYRVADAAQVELAAETKRGSVRIEEAKADLGVAQADIAKASAQIAEANARTAAAELRLEELRQKLGPRRIDEKIFLSALEGVPQRSVLVSHAPDDPDSYFLASSLVSILTVAKWEVRYVEVTSANVKACAAPFGGVTVLSKSISDEEGAALAKPIDERPKTAWLSLAHALTESLQGHSVFQATCPSLPDGALQVVVSPRFVFFPKQ
ncbi:hypothetical protein IVB18_28610 [Bradyrhizobium sp. 186]|uniref:hypothetical protein n=1 Tax=Bradyrhizobium sp. 186 TaxID=2782654 RepID=UPI0020018540|nr:hypothetical protein [Bradyrhizobium sp. 186]UPK32247.1 hypothetical protein IVB18_28610 [Bradyrhizobium sp. 186]